MKKSLGPGTLALPTPVWAVGSYDEDGRPNAMIAAWGGICCSQPPCLTVSVRPGRHTFAGIMRHKAFTVSVCPQSLAAEADFLGLVSGRKTDKFAATGLTPVRGEQVNAPYIDEFPLVVECTLIHSHDLGAHTLMVGEIMDVKCDADKLLDGRHPDPALVQPLVYAPGAGTYHGLGPVVAKGFHAGKAFMK